ncbi:MAG TPA: hypothetical protein VLV54_16010 [Thermoanaerobaculia bacterium]|nr:hypothetical protein [Thermoanaerobaculia bacterium]
MSAASSWGSTHRREPAGGRRLDGLLQDVGGGIRVATVLDPSGNVFGMIENPHFKLP